MTTTIDSLDAEARQIADDLVAVWELFEQTVARFTELRSKLHEYAEHTPTVNGPVEILPPGRVRSGAFQRIPRQQTDALVLKMMGNQEWVSAAQLADQTCDGSREHFDYLRHSYATALRTGHLDGVYELRRHGGTISRFGIGFMDQYRLVGTASVMP